MEDSSLKIYTDVCVLIPFKVFYYIFATFSFEAYGHKKGDGQFFFVNLFYIGKSPPSSFKGSIQSFRS